MLTILTLFLPSYSGPLSIPIRYFSLPFFFNIRVAYKNSFLFALSAFLFFIYIFLASFFERKLNLIDISFILALIFTCYIINFFYKKQDLLHKLIKYFLVVNVAYAFLQNVFLNLGVDSHLLLFHQNTHQVGYFIPKSFIPYIYRATGLFNESVPFVLYLMYTYIYFSYYKNGFFKKLAFLSILLSGSKIALAFIVILFLIYPFKKIKLYWLIYISFALFVCLFVYYNSVIVAYLLDNPVLYSIYLRGEGLFSVMQELSNNSEALWFGAGSISSKDMMDGMMKVNRSTDIISLMIYSNGIIGTLLINIPIFVYFKIIKMNVEVPVLNLVSVSIILTFIVTGTYTFWGYMYLVLILSTFSSSYTKHSI
ncbi:TPA: hypothetical protein NK237_000870 [Vibrio parahaemolyticus]|nr:hypothetical protein [Vibrio parahaemolyticus]HCH6176178.1 hypothetical protein [Vibrio parahaemolyticus]HCH6569314.1 hypothetical protein [Vibrio parahaemolyticus]